MKWELLSQVLHNITQIHSHTHSFMQFVISQQIGITEIHFQTKCFIFTGAVHW